MVVGDRSAMTRIRVDTLRSQVLTSARADELAVAAGGNTLISRAEQAVLAADLQEAAAEVRRNEPGKTVSVDDVARVLGERFDAAVAGVNQTAGPGRPFLSRDEVKNLQAREPLLGARVQRAIDILAAPTGPAAVTAAGADVHARLSAVLGPFFFDGLLGSEGGEKVSAVLLPAMPWPASGAALARALGHDTGTDQGAVERFKAADATLITDFLAQQQAPAADVAIVAALLRGLQDVRVLVVGKDGAPNVGANHPTYLVGAAADGSIVGLKTGVIWT